MKSKYAIEGYGSREEYLKSLAEDFGVPKYKVMIIASILGPEEDFDGLVAYLGNLENMEAIDEDQDS